MDQEFKARWVTALRSGEYEQGKGRLVTNFDNGQKRFCCLGVACELAVEDGLLARYVAENGFSEGYKNHEGRINDVLPEALAMQIGLTPTGVLPQPVMIGGSKHNDLTTLNDEAGWTFAQIADYIEANF